MIQFVESFPPIAIPRDKILHLAQVGPGAVQVAGEQPVQLAVPPPPGTPDSPVDPAGIANWAEGFAVSTTQGVLDQLFPRGGGAVRGPIIVGGDSKNINALTEDLTVMMRILEKSAGAKADGPPTASGILVFSFSQPNSPRAFYLDGYGAMFVLSVKYPLMAPPTKDSTNTNDATNSEWEKAKEEVYGRRGALEDRIKAGQGEEFDAQRVESLQNQIITDLANAKNIRHLKPDEFVTVVVLGGGTRPTMTRSATRGGGGRGGASVGIEMRDLRTSGGNAGAQSTATLRAKKSDIDAFAKGKLSSEEFRKKVSFQVY